MVANNITARARGRTQPEYLSGIERVNPPCHALISADELNPNTYQGLKGEQIESHLANLGRRTQPEYLSGIERFNSALILANKLDELNPNTYQGLKESCGCIATRKARRRTQPEYLSRIESVVGVRVVGGVVGTNSTRIPIRD